MLISLLLTNPFVFLIVASALLGAITIHEFAHAFAADKLGDPTPRLHGRLTLNPLAHLDPIGTILLFIFGFGWGKPVMFDPFNLQNHRRDAAIISFAGPLSNIIVVIFLATIYRLGILQNLFPFFPWGVVIITVVQLNLVLALFNLIPIHPLDGGKILVGLLPHKDAIDVDRFLTRWGTIILILMIFPSFGGVSPISAFMSPIMRFLLNLFIPSLPLA